MFVWNKKTFTKYRNCLKLEDVYTTGLLVAAWENETLNAVDRIDIGSLVKYNTLPDKNDIFGWNEAETIENRYKYWHLILKEYMITYSKMIQWKMIIRLSVTILVQWIGMKIKNVMNECISKTIFSSSGKHSYVQSCTSKETKSSRSTRWEHFLLVLGTISATLSLSLCWTIFKKPSITTIYIGEIFVFFF